VVKFLTVRGLSLNAASRFGESVVYGGVTVHDVECIVGDDPHTFPLGQSSLSKVPSWSIDNQTSRFVIGS
jgi:hypothetical protein